MQLRLAINVRRCHTGIYREDALSDKFREWSRNPAIPRGLAKYICLDPADDRQFWKWLWRENG